MNARNDKISIYGMWLFDPTLFDGMIIPEGLDRENLIDNLIIECTELELLYSDGAFMKQAIAIWSRKQNVVWQRVYDTLIISYNPIWNKDGTVEEKRITDSTGHSRNDSTGVDQVSAYNEEGFHPESKSDGSNTAITSGKLEDTFTRKEYGNIGVTTTQAMMNEEIALRKRNNIYDLIIGDFKRRFCLLVY